MLEVKLHKAASGEPEAGNVDVTEGRNEKRMLDADLVGHVAFQQGSNAPPTIAAIIRLEPLLVSGRSLIVRECRCLGT
jgi:hypothetical protein